MHCRISVDLSRRRGYEMNVTIQYAANDIDDECSYYSPVLLASPMLVKWISQIVTGEHLGSANCGVLGLRQYAAGTLAFHYSWLDRYHGRLLRHPREWPIRVFQYGEDSMAIAGDYSGLTPGSFESNWSCLDAYSIEPRYCYPNWVSGTMRPAERQA
jgi:hypothetical protein